MCVFGVKTRRCQDAKIHLSWHAGSPDPAGRTAHGHPGRCRRYTGSASGRGPKPRFQGRQPRIPEHQNTIYDKLVFWIFDAKTPLRRAGCRRVRLVERIPRQHLPAARMQDRSCPGTCRILASWHVACAFLSQKLEGAKMPRCQVIPPWHVPTRIFGSTIQTANQPGDRRQRTPFSRAPVQTANQACMAL